MSKYKPCPHLDCMYRRDNENRDWGNCAYLDITGHARIKGLTLEQAMDKKNCPHYEPKDGVKPVRRPPIPVDHTNSRIRELYARDGMTGRSRRSWGYPEAEWSNGAGGTSCR